MLLGFTLLAAAAGTSEIPRKINYQGRLTDSATGRALPGYHELEISLFDDASSGTALWSEMHAVNADSSGVFSVILGNSTPLEIMFRDPVWLEVTVDGETLTPRREIVSVPFAFQALNADSLEGYGADDFVLSGDLSSITGQMITDGEITDADIDDVAAIDPAKIAGTAWTSDNDGDGSGLDADMVDGLNADAFSDTGHIHDERYYRKEELRATGTINLTANPVDWTKLKGVPAGLADGTDDEGTGDGHSLDAVDGSPVDAVFVSSAGRVGVGTSTPDEKLDVAGRINTSDSYMIVGRRVLYVPGDHSLALGMDACGGRVVSDITAVGDSAGYACTGAANTFVGSGAGRSNTTGHDNVFVGDHAGYANAGGWANTLLGQDAGLVNTSGSQNTFVGWQAGVSNTAGTQNTFVGVQSGSWNTEGWYNTCVGYGAGQLNETGNGNVFLGHDAGAFNRTGNNNTFLGYGAGHGNQTGRNNTFVGIGAGSGCMAGSLNVFLGSAAGRWETGSRKLYIANGGDVEDVLVYGDFATGRIGLGTLDPERKLHIVGENPRILIEAESVNPEINFKHTGDVSTDVWSIYKENGTEDLRFYQGGNKIWIQGGTGNVGIGGDPGTNKLRVYGTACGSSSWGICSDARLKREIEGIGDALGKVMALRGVTFAWRADEYPEKGFDEGSHYGVIAQEVEEVLPEVVQENLDGEKSVAYSEIIPVLIESIKQLKRENEDLKRRIAAVEVKLD
jgi:hypothetical protein